MTDDHATSRRAGRCRSTPAAPACDATSPSLSWPHDPIPSELLLCGCKMIEINHNGAIYRLRVTRQDKLILTK